MRKVGASGTTITVFGAATAAGERRAPVRADVVAHYRELDRRREAFERHASDILEKLATQGLLDSASAAELPIESFDDERTRLESTAADGTAVTVVADDDEPATLLMAAKNTDSHTIRVYAKPDTDESYAFVRSKDDGSEFAVMPDVDRARLESSEDCPDAYTCGDTCLSCLESLFSTHLQTTTYYSCYKGANYCQCEVSGTECGAEDCWETCSL